MPTRHDLGSRLTGLKPYLQSLVGLVLVINAIGLFTYSIGSGALMAAAGLLVFPQVRDIIEQRMGVSLHPFMLAGIVGGLFIGSSALLLMVVDISQAPDYLVLFEN